MSTIARELDQLLNRLDAETAQLLEQAVRNSLELAQRRANESQPLDELGYPLGYFAETAGSFENDPLERPQELTMEIRPSW